MTLNKQSGLIRLNFFWPLFLLCACTTNQPATSFSNQAKTQTEGVSTPKIDGKEDSKLVEEKVFTNMQVIVPSQEVVKNGLAVSYSMKTMYEGNGYLMQMTLIFRNLKNHRVIVKPKVYLTNNKGGQVKKYTKKEFLYLAKHMMNHLPPSGDPLASRDDQLVAQDKIKWANEYWLTQQHSISPEGIEIASLVYHCNELKLPMTLRINASGDKFIFNINELSNQK